MTSMKPGDLVKVRQRGFGTIMRGPYTYRFMEAQDYEMESHGMGEYAGSYGSAIDVMFHNDGITRRLRPYQDGVEVINEC